MKTEIPSIIITGASGFVGRHFIDSIKNDFKVFAIARRSARESGIEFHQNIHWIQWDISNASKIKDIADQILDEGGADFILHLAAFYDFEYGINPAYQSTNIEGTKNVIELTRHIRIKRFIFASSTAACNFPPKGGAVNEKSMPDADFEYAKTKKYGEELLKKHIKEFPSTIVRFAAVYSDWCEYAPLYKFLQTWLSKGYDSRILGGRGESAVTYIHIQDLVKFLLNVIQKSHQLPRYDIYIASCENATSHKELFDIATGDYFGHTVKPVFLPKFIAYPGILIRILLWRLGLTNMPFERPWMLQYIDLKLQVENSYTRAVLGWEPTPRLNILRRLLFIMTKMKSNPHEWQLRNEAALKHVSFRPSLIIYEHLMAEKERLISIIINALLSNERAEIFSNYQQMESSELKGAITSLYNLIASSVRQSDRSILVEYIVDISKVRFEKGFSDKELILALDLIQGMIVSDILAKKELGIKKQEVYDSIGITVQLAMDEVEDIYEQFGQKPETGEGVNEIRVSVDGIPTTVAVGNTILEAAQKLNIRIPTLCFHKDLKIAGNCRVCVVELSGQKLLTTACATPVEEGMEIFTNTTKVRNARRNILEMLLSEHNADCTQCYKNGKCELQNLASEYKIIEKTYIDLVPEGSYVLDTVSPAIMKDDSKCIRCQRCIRTCSQLQAVSAVSACYRGNKMKISTFRSKSLHEIICTTCGQCIDRCPTGALIERNYIDDVWSAINDKNSIVIVQTAPSVRVALGEDLGFDPGKRVTGKLVSALRRLGFDAVLDTDFSADLTVVEETSEFLERLKKALLENNPDAKLPMATSCSPGWIKFAEHKFPKFLPHISTCKSPQQMFGALVKTYYAKKMNLDPQNIVSVSIMPCTAKKYEADRLEMRSSGFKDVDYVLTTRELAIMIKQAGIDFLSLPEDKYDSIMGKSSGAGVIFGATGGVMEATLRTAYEMITGREIPFKDLNILPVRGQDGIREAEIKIEGTLPGYEFLEGIKLKTAVAHGLANANELIKSVMKGTAGYHLIEIMACPGGCLGGGGQPIPTNLEIREKRAQAIYAIDMGMPLRKAHENPEVQALYDEFLEKPLSKMSHKLLHTKYTIR
jgi:NADP-reducing hydrogenase subunit HndD